jgi:phenylpyruvate tautomerase PptA (4-oxalocrotonate tautomerase family)
MENLKVLDNPNIPEEQKAKIINEISESFDTICNSEKNQNVFEILNIFMNYLKNGEYQFFSESPTQKVNAV